MCSATNTRLRSTSRWIARHRASIGANARPAKISSRGALSSVFHDATVEWSCSDGKVRVEPVEQVPPTHAHGGDERLRLVHLRVDLLAGGAGIVARIPDVRRRRRREERAERVAELQLVRERELDVDPLDAVGVVAQPVERNDDVLVDLEGVRVPGDRRGPGAVEPEFLPGVRGGGDEAFGPARVGDPDHLRGRLRDRVVRLADDVADQHHLRPAVPLRLRRVAHRFHVALVEVLEARQHGACRPGVEVALDLDDRRRRIAHLPEEFEAERADPRRHPVQDEPRGRDEPVAALLLHAGQPGEELVGHILAEARLAKRARRGSRASPCA